MAKLLRESVDQPMDFLLQIGLERSLLGVGMDRCDLGLILCRLMLLRQMIDGRSPRRACQIRLFVPHATPGAAAIKLQEHLLHHVLGVMGVAQDGVCHAKDKAGVAPYKFRKIRIIPPCQAGSTLPFTRKDGVGNAAVQIFFYEETQEQTSGRCIREQRCAIQAIFWLEWGSSQNLVKPPNQKKSSNPHIPKR